MPPKISFIIPCYNLGVYIDSCLDSIARQAVNGAEYVFVNDGSTDSTLTKIEKFVKDKPFCKLISQSNQGVSAARNTALSCCTGDYIYLLDGDDVLSEHAVEHMLDDVADNPDVVISRADRLAGGAISPISFPFREGTYTPKTLYESIVFFHPATQLLYKREIIEEHNILFDSSISLGEVYDFTIRFFQYAQTVKVVAHSYFRYVVRLESATRKPSYNKDLSIIRTIEKYNLEAGELEGLPTFRFTNFKILMAFTYTKYLKQRIKSQEAYDAVKILVTNPEARTLIASVPFMNSAPWRDRLLSAYILVTGAFGYKVLAHLLRKK